VDRVIQPPALCLRQISLGFSGRPILRQLNLDVQVGAIHFILGRSGAGKSLLVKGMVGLSAYDSGSLKFFGEALPLGTPESLRRLRQATQLVFQHSALFDALSVLQNVAMPLRQRDGLGPAAANQRALAALRQVQADHLAHREVLQLGAGLQKRVATARALALRPQLILYDEPTTSLDPVAARRTDALMQDLAATGEITQLVVSHDLQSTAAVATTVSFLHDGRIYFEGTPEALFAKVDDPVLGPFLSGGGRLPPYSRPDSP
jgi:phospholipid/cholesterol/gamma-HCH transport system ATP-binding protein